MTNKFIFVGELESELTLDEITDIMRRLDPTDSICVTKIDEVVTEDDSKPVRILYDYDDFYLIIKDDYTRQEIPADLWERLTDHGICTDLEVSYPRASKYGIPLEATELGGKSFASCYFTVTSSMQVKPIDTEDDSSSTLLLTVEVPNDIYDECQKVLNG